MSTGVSATDWKSRGETVSEPMLRSQDDDDSSELKSHADATTRPMHPQAPVSQPQPIAGGSFSRHRAEAPSMLADVLGILAALAFPIFGAMVIHLNNRETGAEQPHYRNAITTVCMP